MARKRILISGTTGFIGQQLIPYLSKNDCDVLCVSKNPNKLSNYSRVNTIGLDNLLKNKGSSELNKFEPEIFLHLGWAGTPPYGNEILQVNLESSLSLFKIAIESGVKKIFGVGSCYEYGDSLGLLMEEQGGLAPNTLFGECKIEIHKNLISLASKNAVDHSWIRIFHGFGPGQRETSFIPKIIKAATTGDTPFIDFPNKQIDLIHVFDIVRGLRELLISKEAIGIFNLGSGSSDSLLNYANMVYKVLNLPQLEAIQSVSAKSTSSWADISRIENLTGWRPKEKFEDSISKLVLEYSQ